MSNLYEILLYKLNDTDKTYYDSSKYILKYIIIAIQTNQQFVLILT